MGLSSITPEKAWQVALNQLRMDMLKAAFDNWVKHCEFISCQDEYCWSGIGFPLPIKK